MTYQGHEATGGILKAPPANPADLHLSVIKTRPDRGQLICSKKCFEKALKEKRSTMVYEKMFDRDALCLKNVMSHSSSFIYSNISGLWN